MYAADRATARAPYIPRVLLVCDRALNSIPPTLLVTKSFFPFPRGTIDESTTLYPLYHVVRMDIGCSRARVSAIEKMGSLLIESWPSFFCTPCAGRRNAQLKPRTMRGGGARTSHRKLDRSFGRWAMSFVERLFSLASVFGILRGNYGFANDRSFSLSLSIYSASICRGISSLL